VNEIRVDILKWIAEGGAEGLKLPDGLSTSKYISEMNRVLAQNAVVVGFTDKPVIVYSWPKTCRGFERAEDHRLHIECNIDRFKDTPPAEQYMLIHHEYAGLAGIETNDGALSDYTLSSQITEYLSESTVFKLGIKKKVPEQPKESDSFKLVSEEGWGCPKEMDVRGFNYPSNEGKNGFVKGYSMAGLNFIPGQNESGSSAEYGEICGSEGNDGCNYNSKNLLSTRLNSDGSYARVEKVSRSATGVFESIGKSKLRTLETTHWFKIIDAQSVQFAGRQRVNDRLGIFYNCLYRKN
jgi:hypothetical protein